TAALVLGKRQQTQVQIEVECLAEQHQLGTFGVGRWHRCHVTSQVGCPLKSRLVGTTHDTWNRAEDPTHRTRPGAHVIFTLVTLEYHSTGSRHRTDTRRGTHDARVRMRRRDLQRYMHPLRTR